MEKLRNRIWDLYEANGLPRHVAAGWALPEQDTHDLMHVLKLKSPKTVLEIGSYVGITTNLMASFLPDDVRIHAIDPNQPLRVEDGVMTKTEICLTMRPFDLGRAVAQELGIDHKIFWHEGGSTTSKTFATENSSIGSTIPVIGNDVCDMHGPFDFIFIDALHYEFAVRADLELAAKSLAPGGIIAVHDVLGRWGSHVRRALHGFLADHVEFTLNHFPYGALNHGMGFLTRRGTAGLNLQITPAKPEKGLWQKPMVDACCAWVKGHLGVNRILFVGPDAHQHAATLAEQGHVVTHVARKVAIGCEHLFWDEQSPLPSLPVVDLCVCLHAALPCFGESESLIAALCACAPRVLFSATPPGEFGVAHDNALPFQRWAQYFMQHNYAGTDLPLQHLDPWLYAIYNNPFAPNNSYGLFTWLFERTTQAIPSHAISQNSRSATMALDWLAMNSILMDTYRQIQDAGADHENWIALKHAVDEREIQWTEWKKKVDERELEWMEFKRQADEREVKWLEFKRQADEREVQWMLECNKLKEKKKKGLFS